MDMLGHCEILSDKLRKNGFENHFVTTLDNEQRVKKYLLCERVIFHGFVSRKINNVWGSSTPELMGDYIDLMILQKGN